MRHSASKRLLVWALALAPVLALLAWANWQTPNLHDYVPPVTVTRLQYQPGPAEPAAVLEQVPGVTSCAANPAAGIAVVMHQPEQVSPQQLAAALQRAGVRATALPRPPAMVLTGPQCPVPPSYLLALERLRFALNFRRFFVEV
ncbi:heavy-metal-associated domain-containing protein [Hymenobacter oligotrophus]|uniref:heavy-metal-associated domain-containing protein n=1 Tax=Hymenobacter oligotrophus TaxID=2319843 RepID=UPI0013C2B9CB|nr:heavy metal-associated domain-containing protein [Hymenobacter oligotrophus]